MLLRDISSLSRLHRQHLAGTQPSWCSVSFVNLLYMLLLLWRSCSRLCYPALLHPVNQPSVWMEKAARVSFVFHLLMYIGCGATVMTKLKNFAGFICLASTYVIAEVLHLHSLLLVLDWNKPIFVRRSHALDLDSPTLSTELSTSQFAQGTCWPRSWQRQYRSLSSTYTLAYSPSLTAPSRKTDAAVTTATTVTTVTTWSRSLGCFQNCSVPQQVSFAQEMSDRLVYLGLCLSLLLCTL